MRFPQMFGTLGLSSGHSLGAEIFKTRKQPAPPAKFAPHHLTTSLCFCGFGQGLSYRAQFCPVPVTKIWTPYSQTNFFYQYTKKILTSRAFHPCITLGVKDNRKLVEKIFEVKKSPRNGTFCLPLFLVTQVWAVVMAKFAIGSYLSKLPNVLP